MTKFAFIIHPLDVKDVARKYPVAAWVPPAVVEWALGFVSPKIISHITGIRSVTGAETEGVFIGLPMTSRQLLASDTATAVKRIVECGRVAEEAGAQILGLGAFTSVVGDAGLTVAEQLDIGVTTGNSYTVATALEAALLAAEQVGHDPAQCTAAVLGATGSIGRIAAKMLAPQVQRLVLHARHEELLGTVAAEIAAMGLSAEVALDVALALKDADIVIAVTSAVEAIVHPQMLKPGAVVCDVARPRDVSRQVAEQRKDVLVIEGGAVAVPGDVQFNFDFGFPPKEAYACMAETMILALEGRTGDYSLGREIRQEQVEEMRSLAAKHGFRLAGFRSFERRVEEADIARVREYVKATAASTH